MSRSRRSRAFTALLGLWFLVAGQEPPFPHPCEMGGANASAAATSAGPGEVAQSDEHAEHSEHTAHAAASDESPSHAPAHGTCECIGDCCCAPAVDRVAAPSWVESRETIPFVVPAASVARAQGGVTRYLLPWANGPPGSLI